MTEQLQDVLADAQEKWMDLDGVQAVGQGRTGDRDCIVVYVSEKSAAVDREIPSEYKDVPVDIRDSGGRIGAQ